MWCSCAEGYASTAADLGAEQLRHRGISAESAADDPVRMAGTLVSLKPDTLVIGISATKYGEAVASALAYARSRGCATLGIVGSLASPVNRMSDQVVYAPTDVAGPLPSIVAIVAALSALIQIAARDTDTTSDLYMEEFEAAYEFSDPARFGGRGAGDDGIGRVDYRRAVRRLHARQVDTPYVGRVGTRARAHA